MKILSSQEIHFHCNINTNICYNIPTTRKLNVSFYIIKIQICQRSARTYINQQHVSWESHTSARAYGELQWEARQAISPLD